MIWRLFLLRRCHLFYNYFTHFSSDFLVWQKQIDIFRNVNNIVLHLKLSGEIKAAVIVELSSMDLNISFVRYFCRVKICILSNP